MGKQKRKYYLIAGESVLDLLQKINDQNIRTINTYRRTACIQQVIEPSLSPGEYFAILYDVELPANGQRHNYAATELPPIQTRAKRIVVPSD